MDCHYPEQQPAERKQKHVMLFAVASGSWANEGTESKVQA